MKLIKFEQTEKFKNGENCEGGYYNMGSIPLSRKPVVEGVFSPRLTSGSK